MSLVNKIGIGTAQFGIDYGISNSSGQTAFSEASAIIDFARHSGIEVIDTATAYGQAEKILGRIGTADFDVVSKFIVESKHTIAEQLNHTLKNLRSQCLYGFLAHRPQDIISTTDLWKELKELKETGHIKKIGFSLNQPEEAYMALDKGMVPDLVQLPFNYFDTRFNLVIDELKKVGTEIHARSAFLQGLFFIDPKQLPSHFDQVKPVLSGLSSEYGDTLPARILQYVVNSSVVDKVIVGVESLIQFKQNISYLGIAFPDKMYPCPLEIDPSILMPSCWPNK